MGVALGHNSLQDLIPLLSSKWDQITADLSSARSQQLPTVPAHVLQGQEQE